MSKIDCKVWDEREIKAYAHLKIDGHFTRIVRDKFGTIKILSSQDTDLTEIVKGCKPTWLFNLYRLMPIPYHIIGELYYAGKPASYIKSGLANKIPPRFSGFAIFEDKNLVDKPLERMPLEDIQSIFLKMGIESTPYIKLAVPRDYTVNVGFEGKNYNRVWRSLWNTYSLLEEHLPLICQRKDVAAITEGWVLKDGNLSNWRKLKKIKTIDVFITSFNWGEGKYLGQVGSLNVSVYLHKTIDPTDLKKRKRRTIASVSGFNDEIRGWLSSRNGNNKLNVEDLIENRQVIEVAYAYVGAGGRLRFPQFKNWRDDKTADECSDLQDLDL